MTRTILCAAFAILMFILAVFAVIFGPVKARADELSDRARWFKELTVPGSTVKCCDISDGHPVEARMQGTTWFVRIGDQWMPVPPEIVLKTVSIDQSAYLFVWGGKMRCFVPPLQGF